MLFRTASKETEISPNFSMPDKFRKYGVCPSCHSSRLLHKVGTEHLCTALVHI